VQPATDRSELPKTGDQVVVHCNASLLTTGEMIDSTRERCQAISFTVGAGHVCPAMDEASRKMRKGEKCIIKAPAELCFGDKGGKLGDGLVPAKAGLHLEMEVVDINESLMASNIRLQREKDEQQRAEEMERAILEHKTRQKIKSEKKRKKADSSSSSDSDSEDSEEERRKKAKRAKKKAKHSKKEDKKKKKKKKKEKKSKNED